LPRSRRPRSPKDRLKRFEALTGIRPDDPETKMLKAELLIAAEDFPAARRALGDLATTDPTTRSLSIMAAVERGEGADDAVVRGLAGPGHRRAARAAMGLRELRDRPCPLDAGLFELPCFDTLAWRRPTQAEVQAPTSAGMLPLIVGQPARRAGRSAVTRRMTTTWSRCRPRARRKLGLHIRRNGCYAPRRAPV
jgi:HemY protein